jgi:hypothetical protein
MMKFLGQMMKLPITAFVYSIDMLARTLQGLQRMADHGIDAMLAGTVQESSNGPDSGSDLKGGGITQTLGDPPGSQSNLTSDRTKSLTSGTSGDSAETSHKEARKMRDTDLSDHKMLKLVRYKILFIKRKYEVAFPEQEELIADDTTDTGYTAWKIAQFIQELDRIKVPSQWGGSDNPEKKPRYPEDAIYSAKEQAWVVHELDEDDKKFLRVYFEVLDRYQREKLHKEERQIEVLEQIRDRI